MKVHKKELAYWHSHTVFERSTESCCEWACLLCNGLNHQACWTLHYKTGQWGRIGSQERVTKPMGWVKRFKFSAGLWERKPTVSHSFQRNLVNLKWSRLVSSMMQLGSEAMGTFHQIGGSISFWYCQSYWERGPSHWRRSRDKILSYSDKRWEGNQRLSYMDWSLQLNSTSGRKLEHSTGNLRLKLKHTDWGRWLQWEKALCNMTDTPVSSAQCRLIIKLIPDSSGWWVWAHRIFCFPGFGLNWRV